MNILCNEGGFVGKFVNEGDIALGEIGSKWGRLGERWQLCGTMFLLEQLQLY